MSRDAQMSDKTIQKIQYRNGYKSQEINGYFQVEEAGIRKRHMVEFWDS